MTLLHGPRSGDHVRARRRHHFQQDLQNADCILIQGSSMAEAHPVGFRWVMKARERGATIIHVDPRFSRTSAMADMHVPIRAGSDIAFLGGLIRHVLETESLLQGLRRRTTRTRRRSSTRTSRTRRTSTASSPAATRDGDLRPRSWRYEGGEVAAPRASASTRRRRSASTTGAGMRSSDGRARRDAAAPALRLPDAEAPLRALHAGDGRARSAASRRSTSSQVAETLIANSGRERTTRSATPSAGRSTPPACRSSAPAAILQLLLGNIGPARRRHHRAARPCVDPGLDRHPDALRPAARLPADAAARATETLTLADIRREQRRRDGLVVATSTSTSSRC